MITEIKGDLLKVKTDVFCHVANCFHTMGAGVAAQIKKKYPEVFEADLKTLYGWELKMGRISLAKTQDGKTGINLYAQYEYGQQRRHLDYEALYKALLWVKEEFSGKIIAFPKLMGCGLAGGSWPIVLAMIEDIFENENILIVEYA